MVAFDPEDPAHQRQRLGVVARRMGDDPARPLLVAQPADRVVRAAKLECAHALQVLALEKQLRPADVIEQPRRGDRGAVGDAGDALGSGQDIIECDHGLPRRSLIMPRDRTRDPVAVLDHVDARAELILQFLDVTDDHDAAGNRP